MSSADARPVELEKKFETDKTFGVGVMLGVPTAVSAKYFLIDELAVDLGLGAYLLYRDRDGFALHGDVLWHPFVAVEGTSFLAPLYFGAGVRLLDHDDSTRVGIRLPVGITFDFVDSPFDVFGESTLVVDVSVSNDDGTSPVDANFVVGLRYYL